jgi:putative ABC transport system permease protein
MVRSFVKMYRLDVGFQGDNLMAMSVQLPDEKYPHADGRRAFFERLEPRLAALPGVQAVAVTTSVPPFGAEERPVEIDGQPLDPEQQAPEVATVSVSPAFFDVLGLQVRGRAFQEADGATSSGAIIVNERFATQFFGKQDPLGRRVRFGDGENGQPEPWLTVVGVSPALRHSSPQEAEVNAVVYLPYRQAPPDEASLLVRSALPQASLMEAVRREVQAVDPDQPVYSIQTVEQMLAQARWPFRVFGGLFAIFAAIALVLASVGLYSVTAYAVAQRTHEIGVRMAVGAGAREIAWLILRRGQVQLAIGLGIGLAGAWALSRVLQRVVVQISTNDPLTFVTIALVLTIVSIAACLIPARRATRVDPVVALRPE